MVVLVDHPCSLFRALTEISLKKCLGSVSVNWENAYGVLVDVLPGVRL